jgi:spore maturation protein CgeB
MKILFLGEIGEGQTSLMRMRALKRLGHQVCGIHTVQPWMRRSWFARQLQRRSQRGPAVTEINRSVVETARAFRPDIVWAEKQEFLHVDTIEDIRKLGAKLVHFTPDPYFSLPWKRTRLMDEAIRAFDVLIYCKSYERQDYEALGKPLVYMPLGYCDEVHRPLASDDSRWSCAVGFLGGWEPRRERLLRAVCATGADVKVWGGHWDFVRDGRWGLRRYLILRQLAGDEPFRLKADPSLAKAWQGGEIYADDYARALTASKIGLGFLRKICPDQHTTRTFEIPACGSLLLADRTQEHQDFFEEGKEAEFFDSPEELADKVRFYCTNEPARMAIAKAGYTRCVRGKYAYVDRLRSALDAIALFEQRLDHDSGIASSVS